MCPYVCIHTEVHNMYMRMHIYIHRARHRVSIHQEQRMPQIKKINMHIASPWHTLRHIYNIQISSNCAGNAHSGTGLVTKLESTAEKTIKEIKRPATRAWGDHSRIVQLRWKCTNKTDIQSIQSACKEEADTRMNNTSGEHLWRLIYCRHKKANEQNYQRNTFRVWHRIEMRTLDENPTSLCTALTHIPPTSSQVWNIHFISSSEHFKNSKKDNMTTK